MCGRFVAVETVEEIIELFEPVPSNTLPETPNFNVCPTDQIHVVYSDETGRRLVGMRWGFLTEKNQAKAPLINARSETIATLPSFRDACRERRCLIPAAGFYEWTKGENDQRLPWYICRRDNAAMMFAGVWQSFDTGDHVVQTCAIVTTAAKGEMAGIHSRAPVMIERDDWALWLGEQGHGAAPLMRAAPDGVMKFDRVAVDVNSNRASGSALIVALSESE